MTEKQIKQLKNLLAESSLADDLDQSTKELDAQILSAAHRHQTTETPVSSFLLFSLFGFPFGVLGTASLAIVLTVALFLGMSQMIVPEERQLVLNSDVEFDEGKLVTSNTKVRDLFGAKGSLEAKGSPEAKGSLSRPELLALEDAPSKMSRDRILMDFSLPATNEMLANMQFDLDQDRITAEQAIDIAMIDISSMIELGTFDSARERYAKLIESCQTCVLPSSLEALVLSSDKLSSDTG